MPEVDNSNTHHIATAEFGKFIKVSESDLYAEIGGDQPNESFPKYAILTYNVGESPAISSTTGAVRGTDIEMYQDTLLSLGTSTTHTLAGNYYDDGVESVILTLISNSGTFCRLNFSGGSNTNSATFGINFSIDDTIRIDGLDALTKLTFATDGNLSVYASFIRYT